MKELPAKIVSLTKIQSSTSDNDKTLLIALCDDGRMYNQTITFYGGSIGWDIGKWYLHTTPASLNTKP
jgi:hypothetical protein